MKDIKSIYFIGAGGSGMSALVRYFLVKGYKVGGYDKIESDLTATLIIEGADIHFEDNIDKVNADFKDPKKTLIVRTPAVPEDMGELTWFREHGFKILKRAELLGLITRQSTGLCRSEERRVGKEFRL